MQSERKGGRSFKPCATRVDRKAHGHPPVYRGCAPGPVTEALHLPDVRTHPPCKASAAENCHPSLVDEQNDVQ